MNYPPKLKQIYIPENIYAQLTENRDRFNKHWSLGDYMEHLIATHAKVMDLQEKKNDDN
jgi:hypothetical protein